MVRQYIVLLVFFNSSLLRGNKLFDYIKGKISYISSKYIVIENQGVGYQVLCANPFLYQDVFGEETTIYTYHYVREDMMALYGFKSREERELFIQLLSVSGIGPKGGLAILASGKPESIIQAIDAENESYLTKFPGIGKKTARQIILDLKGKLDQTKTGLFNDHDVQNDGLDEALEALKALGYSDKEVKRVVPKLKDKDYTAEQYIKEALKLMLNG